MRIEIDPCVANESDAHQWLDRILHKISDGWHLWDTSSHLNSSEFEATRWIKDRGTKGDEILDLFRKSSTREAWDSKLHTKRIRVTAYPQNENERNPEDAARIAEQKLCILVENEFGDGLFLQRIIEILDKPLSQYWNQNPKPIYIDSVGGATQMGKAVKRRSDEAGFIRLIAIADSDKKSPSDEESRSAQKLRTACEERGIRCWILAKRAAENYLPPTLLKKMKPDDQEHIHAVDAWDKLNDDQKNFFDMKKGLPPDRDDLFEDVPESDYIILRGQFGRNISRCWKHADMEIEKELRLRSQGDLEYGIELIRKEV